MCAGSGSKIFLVVTSNYSGSPCSVEDEQDGGGVGDGQGARGDMTASVFRRLILVFFNMVA